MIMLIKIINNLKERKTTQQKLHGFTSYQLSDLTRELNANVVYGCITSLPEHDSTQHPPPPHPHLLTTLSFGQRMVEKRLHVILDDTTWQLNGPKEL